MANISDVYGTLTFRTCRKKQDNDLINALIDVTTKWYYCQLVIDEVELEKLSAYYFNSTGRWSFYNSLESFARNIQSTIDENRLDERAQYIREHIADLDGLKLEFEYSEYEPGCSFLQEAEAVITLKYDEELPGELSQDFNFNCIGIYEDVAQSQEKFFFMENPVDTITAYGVKTLADYIAEDLSVTEEMKWALTERLFKLLENDEIEDNICCDYVNFSILAPETNYQIIKILEEEKEKMEEK